MLQVQKTVGPFQLTIHIRQHSLQPTSGFKMYLHGVFQIHQATGRDSAEAVRVLWQRLLRHVTVRKTRVDLRVQTHQVRLRTR